MIFNDELKFEKELINILHSKGWEKEVLRNKTEKDLIDNWASILFENNRGIDRLNDHPLTDGEMAQILNQIRELRIPVKLNGFINGRTVSIKRDNPDDKEHFGKEVSLKIYDRREIAAGQSRYQIVSQPIFETRSKMLNNRRGDLFLLINGMPVIHIELKKSGIPISQAVSQIEKYAYEGVYSGLFSLVQIFVAMTPEETRYLANPGPENIFNADYYFNWADFDNEKINQWDKVASQLLAIPMAHELIGFYTIADEGDGILKVMRSYQYYAARSISVKVKKHKWVDKNQMGGYVWHTTGSGKTLTSFKSAQLIANSKDADKVVFLMDRIELGTQSLREYRGFADDSESVQATENTDVLVNKLKSDNHLDSLIVTSIQKMSRIKEDSKFKQDDIDKINSKRIVFIVDEAHRSTFGDMMSDIKATFPYALFFGFTGTPIIDENQKNMNTTADVFGDELHRYSIADGIRDKNVLGFDPSPVATFKDRDLRKVIAFEKAKVTNEQDAFNDESKKQVYQEYMSSGSTEMAGYINSSGEYIWGIEDFIPKSQYETTIHREKVVEDILESWTTLSVNSKFHALFATSSINEAIEYYRLFKAKNHNLKITALFDSNIDNNDNAPFKIEGLVEILDDYNKIFEQEFTMPTHDKFKKDVSLRLAHKSPYISIGNTPEKQIDILIVVDQMLTGFDSKWINTLYLDKLLENERIIQAFSRTNRLFGKDKPFGTVKYYRKPHTMKRNVEKAFKLYSGEKPFGLFAIKLDKNLIKMNEIFDEIKSVFQSSGIDNFDKLPEDSESKKKFAALFSQFNKYLEAAKIQGFRWSKLTYSFGKSPKIEITLNLDESIYMALVLRYKELAKDRGSGNEDIPYDIEGYLTEINTEIIDADYMNSRFVKFFKVLRSKESEDIIQNTLDELHKTFATLTQEEQAFARIFLHDVQSGNIEVDEEKTLKDYIVYYQGKAREDRIFKFANAIGVDEQKLREFMRFSVTEKSINEFGRFDKLKNSVDILNAKIYFENKEGRTISTPLLKIKIDKILRKFVIEGGFEI
ncbi:MAG: HsdR family type I site-specific deoxyribonuclease [Dysgonamonadaceae bacterium]|nr:HsdR family type I site-specific deoxyribonuclease [Dysgonamonadaceae bacterium]